MRQRFRKETFFPSTPLKRETPFSKVFTLESVFEKTSVFIVFDLQKRNKGMCYQTKTH